MSENEWLAAAPPSDVVDNTGSSAATTPPTSRRLLAVRTGLVAAGAVVGGIVVSSVHHDSTTAATPTSFSVPQGTGGQFPGGQLPQGGTGQLPQGGTGQLPQGGGFGGLAGEQRLAGTLVSVGSSSVTIRTSSGRETYAVTSATEIVRNGQVASLSALRAGDSVFVHVYPSGSGSQLTVERLFAGTSATASRTTTT